jgi:hypothetical protein
MDRRPVDPIICEVVRVHVSRFRRTGFRDRADTPAHVDLYGLKCPLTFVVRIPLDNFDLPLQGKPVST